MHTSAADTVSPRLFAFEWGHPYTRPTPWAEASPVRFELIDRVLERQPDRLVAIKTVTTAEEYLADHFPGFAVLPGVMMLEALVQAGRQLVAKAAGLDDAAEPLVLSRVRNLRYGNMVRPGQTLRVEVSLRSQADGVYELAGVGDVDGQKAVNGRFTLVPAGALAR